MLQQASFQPLSCHRAFAHAALLLHPGDAPCPYITSQFEWRFWQMLPLATSSGLGPHCLLSWHPRALYSICHDWELQACTYSLNNYLPGQTCGVRVCFGQFSTSPPRHPASIHYGPQARCQAKCCTHLLSRSPHKTSQKQPPVCPFTYKNTEMSKRQARTCTHGDEPTEL